MSNRLTTPGSFVVTVLAMFAGAIAAQQSGPPKASAAPGVSLAANPDSEQANGDSRTNQSKHVRERDRRRAAKLYMDASKRFENGQFERALDEYQRAAELDPSNQDYVLACQVARSHAVTALIQTAAKDRTAGDASGARSALERARALDPQNPQVAEHVYELADDLAASRTQALYQEPADEFGQVPILEPSSSPKSFHLKTDKRQLIEQVYKAFGIEATVDQSVSANLAQFDLEDGTFKEAVDALNMVTQTFAVPLDPHRVLVARDTRENRQQFLRQELETVHVPELTQAELTELTNIAKNVFSIQQAQGSSTTGTITMRATPKTLDAFNVTVRNLLDGHSQVMLNVRIFQLAHNHERNTGVQGPQQVTAFNVFAEEQAILNQNKALVQQIISSGLASPGDTLAILGILLASGAVSNSIFNNGIALFGGGLTLSGISPQPATVHLNLNSSDSRELDDVELRLSDGQDETITSGSRYPILTASFSSGLTNSGLNIPGLTGAGSSSGLSSLLSTVNAAQQTQIPQVQYQNLGLTMKATPKTMRSGDVALTLDLKITALAGSSLNGIPVLNNRSYSGVITLREGAGAVLMSELDKQESLALSGTPGLTEIPGLNNITEKDNQQNYATLMIVLTPHLIRGPHMTAGHSPLLRIERTGLTQ